jgi:hypothetical protein
MPDNLRNQEVGQRTEWRGDGQIETSHDAVHCSWNQNQNQKQRSLSEIEFGLFGDREYFNLLHSEVAFTREDLLAVNSGIVGIAIPEIRGTVGVLIAAVPHNDVATIPKSRTI